MEWSWKTVLILIGLMLVIVIVVDGLRRMNRARSEALRIDLEPELGRFSDDVRNSELPNSGVRVIKRAEPRFSVTSPVALSAVDDIPPVFEEPRSVDDYSNVDDFTAAAADSIADPVIDDRIIPWEDELGDVRVLHDELVSHDDVAHSAVHDLEIPPSVLIPKARPVNLDEQVPVLLEVEELGADDMAPVIEPFEPVETATAEDSSAEEKPEPVIQSAALAEALALHPDMEEELEDMPSPIPLHPVSFADPNAEKLSARPDPEVVLQIHCIARDPQGFSGKDILFLFNSCDLRFGEKDIFHRFELPDSKGRIQFSVAQSFNPGVFAPADMAQQHFQGISFFMSLPGAEKPLEAYEAMTGVAMVLARKFNAELYDGGRSALTHQTIEHDRQQIIDFERRQKLAAKKHERS